MVTLAIDGDLLPEVKEKPNALSDKINIHVITADTFGNAQKNLKDIRCQFMILTEDEQQFQKKEYISKLGVYKVIAIGNGSNDALMLKNAALGIVVIQKECASVKSLVNADIICNGIIDALDFLTNPLRVAATLRI